jgi:hypothetical protein
MKGGTMSNIPLNTRPPQDPIPGTRSLSERDRRDRDLHRVAQDFDDDANLLERNHGHRHVVASLQRMALRWREPTRR